MIAAGFEGQLGHDRVARGATTSSPATLWPDATQHATVSLTSFKNNDKMTIQEPNFLRNL